MNTDTRSPLPEQLRAIVDGVDTPTFADIRVHASAPKRTRSPRTRVAIGLAAVLVFIALGAGVVAFLDRTENTDPARRPVATTVPTNCIITITNYAGCEMTAKRAQRYLGFRPRVPQNVPEGWVQQPSRLKIYRSQFDPASLPPGATEVTEFFQIWAPRGSPPIADRPAAFTCTPDLVVRQRMALVGEDALRTDAGTVDLGNGRVVNGTLGPEACVTGGPVDPHGDLFWDDQGRSCSLTTNDIPTDQILAIARSLDR
jgi:hypothetical protein